MTRTAIVGWLIQAATVALAFALARRRPEHRPVALWAGAALGSELVRLAILTWCPWIMVGGPHEGRRQAIFHLDQALFLVEPVGLAALSWVTLLRRRPWAPLAAGSVVLAALVLGYPAPFRGAALGTAYAVVHAAACVATVASFAAWTRRRAHVRPWHAATLFAGALEAVLLAGPYAPPALAPWADWSESVILALWGGLFALHVASLWAGLWLEPAPPRGGARAH